MSEMILSLDQMKISQKFRRFRFCTLETGTLEHGKEDTMLVRRQGLFVCVCVLLVEF